MLSVENPPPDPSRSCQLTQLNASNSDERTSHNKLPLPEVDLLKPPLDHLPKFSIRDYVFTSRSKDIKKNWPFSLNNLQLCLRHGVTEVLPPFQDLSAVKTDQSLKRCTVETGSLEKSSISNFDAAEPSDEPKNEKVPDSSGNAQLNDKLENACIDTKQCQYGGENNFPSTTRVSQSEIESVLTKRPSSLPLETDRTLLEASVSASASVTVEVGVTGNPTSHKTENTPRPLGKKCRLIVKFSGNCDCSSTEDIASNSTAVLEPMASKVCPVCKTFTSSSNTTLNAHIDQCLSAESTPKWTADSRPTRHRIKPRKTRLMVDIYATAKRCTLEELDKRNGTCWAAVSSFPTQDVKQLDQMPTEWKRRRVSQVHPEDAGDVGEVYIDANGTKLRILSKSNDAPMVSKEVEDFRPKGSKFLSIKKKKCHARKHLKYLKLAPQSEKIFSHKTHASQICGDQEGDYGVEECSKMEKHRIIKSGDSGPLRQWVCSKRRGLSKKVNIQASRRTFRYKWNLPHDLLVDSDQSSLGESPVERNHIQKYANLSENLLYSPAVSERVEKPFYEAQIIDKWELSSGRKRGGSPLFGAKVSDTMERSCLLHSMKQNDNQLSRDSPITHGSHTAESSNSNRNCVSSLINKEDGFDGSPDNDFDILPSASTKPSICTQAFAPESLRPVLRKSRSSVFKPKPNRDEECSARKQTRLYPIGNVDEVAAWHLEVDQRHALMCNGTENVGRKYVNDKTSFSGCPVEGMRQDRGAINTSQGEETMALESSEQAPQCHGHCKGEKTDSSARASDDLIDKVDVLEYVASTVTSKSIDTKSQRPSNRSSIQTNSLHSIGDYNGMLRGRTEPSFVDGQDMYSSDEVGNGIIEQSSHMAPDLDFDIKQGNSLPEVDPIPIPGPPGSFLPSPRDMGSDDFQGNSSLTTSQVQSSQDQLDLVDGDSSDSPISAASTISNSIAARSDLKYSKPLSSVVAHAVQDKKKLDFSDAGFEPLVENAAVVKQTGIGAEKTYFDGETFKVNRIAIEKRTLNFKNDGQRCCCHRKERISQDVAPNYSESPLLSQCTIASVTVPAMLKPNERPNNLDVRPEIFALNTCQNFVSEKVVLPVMKSTASSIPEAGVKFFGHSDCNSPSPSTPNPILRLMGKNLMVVNKEEDASVPLVQSQPCSQNGHAIAQFPTASWGCPGNMQNQDSCSFPHMVPQGPVLFSHNPYDVVGKSFDVRLLGNFRNQTNPRAPQTPVHVSAGMSEKNHHINGCFGTHMEPCIYEDTYSLSGRHDRSKIRLSEASSYHMGNVVSTLDRPDRNADCGASIKEIIVIDDAPESEAKVSADVAKYSDGLKASQPISSGISIPTVPNFNSRHVKSFSCYRSQDHLVLGESPPVHNSNFHAILSRLPNTSPVRWGCTPEGSGVLQRGPFVAASTSTAHVRSGPYYSPRLS